MKVIIANFGRGNYLWPQCLERNTVATNEDVELRPFFLSGDRKAYIEQCIATVKTFRGQVPTRAVASRWFSIGLEIAETNGDMWIHREKNDIWWTITSPGPAEAELQPKNLLSSGGQMIYTIHKPAAKWSNRDRKGRRLDWTAIHPKAKNFLFTESTLVRFSDDNAEYVQTLINGGDLAAWHEQKTWKDKLGSAKTAPVVIFSPMQMAALRMVNTAIATTNSSNGQVVESIKKNKDHMFDSAEEFRKFVEGLIFDQESLCALSGLPLQYDSMFEDAEMLASLDRIDSDGHYEPGNLQVVCRFINRWKSSDKDANFSRLLNAVRANEIT